MGYCAPCNFTHPAHVVGLLGSLQSLTSALL
jgi:hypothetical protein